MNNQELVKALRVCNTFGGTCDGCPCYQGGRCESPGLEVLAADAIEALEAQHEADAKEIEWLKKCVAELPRPQKWIPVTERLPEEEKSVLVYIEADEYMQKVVFSPKNQQFNNYDSLPYDERNTFNEVTHWMPLPEPPEEGT